MKRVHFWAYSFLPVICRKHEILNEKDRKMPRKRHYWLNTLGFFICQSFAEQGKSQNNE
jgi:hypothetical protein